MTYRTQTGPKMGFFLARAEEHHWHELVIYDLIIISFHVGQTLSAADFPTCCLARLIFLCTILESVVNKLAAM